MVVRVLITRWMLMCRTSSDRASASAAVLLRLCGHLHLLNAWMNITHAALITAQGALPTLLELEGRERELLFFLPMLPVNRFMMRTTLSISLHTRSKADTLLGRSSSTTSRALSKAVDVCLIWSAACLKEAAVS